MGNMFKSGEIVISDGGRATSQDIIKGGGNVGWAAPEEGVLSWVCGLSISADAENLDAAYAFINDHSSPETQALFGNNGFVMINPKAVPLVDEEFVESCRPDDPGGRARRGRPRERRHLAQVLAGGAGRVSHRLRVGDVLALGLVSVVLVILIGPIVLLTVFSFNDSTIISLPFEGFTLEWYQHGTRRRRRPGVAAQLDRRGRDRGARLCRARDGDRVGDHPVPVPGPGLLVRPGRRDPGRALAGDRRQRAGVLRLPRDRALADDRRP